MEIKAGKIPRPASSLVQATVRRSPFGVAVNGSQPAILCFPQIGHHHTTA